MSIKENLEQSVAAWEFLGVPALLERFVLRNGKAFKPRKRIGRKRKAKMCFMNAFDFVSGNEGTQYVEGFTTTHGISIHHAWVTTTGDDAMDPTLDAAEHEYFGVTFTREQMIESARATGYYSILDQGMGLNAELMFALDPELEQIVKAIKPRSRAELLAAVQKITPTPP